MACRKSFQTTHIAISSHEVFLNIRITQPHHNVASSTHDAHTHLKRLRTTFATTTGIFYNACSKPTSATTTTGVLFCNARLKTRCRTHRPQPSTPLRHLPLYSTRTGLPERAFYRRTVSARRKTGPSDGKVPPHTRSHRANRLLRRRQRAKLQCSYPKPRSHPPPNGGFDKETPHQATCCKT